MEPSAYLICQSVLNAGYLQLEEWMGGDLDVVNAARVSFNAECEKMDESAEGLLRYLMKNGHGTPFEHVVAQFKVRCPIFVAREWFRHRIGSFNEESSRYHQLKEEFYIPEDDHIRRQVGKPGAYIYEPVDDQWAIDHVRETMIDSYETAWDAYQTMLQAGIAKELARDVLPLGIYTTFMWTVNMRSLMNFLALRNSPHALQEFRDYAQIIEQMFQERMPITHDAFVGAGRVAP